MKDKFNDGRMKLHFLPIALFLLLSVKSFAQSSIIDSCFTSTAPCSTFVSTADLANFDGDLMEWDGTSWIGAWPQANLTTPPPLAKSDCRAIFIGNGVLWTSGGEGFALRLLQPLVAGQTYSFPITYVSAGLGSDGNFCPKIYTNSMGSMIGEVYIDSLFPAGYNWTTQNFTFTASLSQNGHEWLLIQSDITGTSGMVSSFCENCTKISNGVSEFDISSAVNISPNPFTNEISISLSSMSAGNVSFTITNSLGQIVFESKELNFANSSVNTIGLSFLARGFYFLHIFIDDDEVVKKILKN